MRAKMSYSHLFPPFSPVRAKEGRSRERGEKRDRARGAGKNRHYFYCYDFGGGGVVGRFLLFKAAAARFHHFVRVVLRIRGPPIKGGIRSTRAAASAAFFRTLVRAY